MFLSSWPSPSKCKYVIYLYFVQEVFNIFPRSLVKICQNMSKKSLLCIQEVFTICPRSLWLRSLYYISKKFSLYVQEVLSHFIFILIQYKSKIVKISYLSSYYMSKKSYPILSLYLYNTSQKCVIYLYFMSKKSLLHVQEVFTMYPRSL